MNNLAFSAFDGSIQNISAGSTATIIFDTLVYDRQNGATSSNYNALTSTFTAPFAGIYRFEVNTRVIYASGSGLSNPLLIVPLLNGTALLTRTSSLQLTATATGTNVFPLVYPIDLQLAVGDQVQFSFKNSSSVAITLGAQRYVQCSYVAN